MSFTVGVDVGGTNTDVVIIHGNQVIGWNKSSTTEKIIDGVINSIELAVENALSNGHSMSRVVLGKLISAQLILLMQLLSEKILTESLVYVYVVMPHVRYRHLLIFLTI